eukprot:IDg1627t1
MRKSPFQSGVRDILTDDEELIAKTNSIMVKLQTLLLGAKLRKLTLLRPKIRNQTRCSSTFEMIVRYQQLRDYLPELNAPDIDEISYRHLRIDVLMRLCPS